MYMYMFKYTYMYMYMIYVHKSIIRSKRPADMSKIRKLVSIERLVQRAMLAYPTD